MKEIIIWSKDGCMYCEQAKSLLSQKGLSYLERKIGHGYTKENLLEQIPSAKTVPQIVIDGEVIGGYTELKKLFE